MRRALSIVAIVVGFFLVLFGAGITPASPGWFQVVPVVGLGLWLSGMLTLR